MPRQPIPLVCNETDRVELERLSRSRTESKQLVERSKIILDCLQGKMNKDIAADYKTRPNRITKWRQRFSKSGIAGLVDSPRSGKPSKREFLKKQILRKLETPPPPGQACWDGKSLAAALEVKPGSVWGILRKEGIQLQRTRSWCVSTDEEFATKSADIIGLYLNPPERALVICIDEKPSIQALERATGYVETSSGKIVRGLKSTYKRHGTINLFAALQVSTGEVKTKTTESKKREDFLTFMNDVIRDVPEEQEVHVILDNYCTHKKNDEWLAIHPNVKFHFTPTSASWLNQVEIWFGILTRKALRGASFKNIESVIAAINEFTGAYHKNAKPFVWKKREVKGSQLKNTIANLLN
jgi:transposase